jgi:HPt (histidine-containing phosphotransfer) domain-containing protein
MADNIVAGLFGLNPQMYGEQQRVGALNEGIALAQLDPAARGAALTYAGARGLGTAIGGAMGVEDPQLRLVSARNTIAQQIDQNDPESVMRGAKALAQIGDTQGAFTLADYARKAKSEMAQAQQRLAAASRERQQATPNDIQIANEIATLEDTLGQLENVEASPERTRAKNMLTTRLTELRRITTKGEKAQSFGVEREAVAKELYNKPFADLTQAEIAAVNKRVDAEKPRTTITNVLPGDKTLADIPGFRKQVQDTVKAQSQAVFAADNALENIKNSIETGNFASYRAAQTQFAKAIAGAGDLSQKELKAAGADPALLGGTADYLATLFTSTPTLDTQNKIKTTLEAIKKVSTQKAKAEIEAQRKIAYSNPGFDKARVDQALDFPEFSGVSTAEKKTNTRTLKSGKVVTVIEE